MRPVMTTNGSYRVNAIDIDIFHKNNIFGEEVWN
jgi:hypothetical protein